MAQAFDGVWNLRSNLPVNSEQVGAARKLVGEMLDYASFNDLPITSRVEELGDGTIISVIINGTMPVVTITVPTSSSSLNQQIQTALWIPRGFYGYPSTSSAPYGYGLPVVPADTNYFASTNLNPGLDIGRWTPGGPHNAVLITRDNNADYPNPTINVSVPMHYSARGPTVQLAAGYDARADSGQWYALRESYADFTQSYGSPISTTSLRQAMFTAVNAYRTQAGVAPAYLLPQAIYREAETYAQLIAVNGTNENGFPLTYQTNLQRLSKDGFQGQIDGQYAEFTVKAGSPASALQAITALPNGGLLAANTAAIPLTLDIGYANSQWTVTLEPRTDWLSAGNRAFQPADTQLPPISWNAPASLNLGYSTLPISFNATAYAPYYPLTQPSGLYSEQRAQTQSIAFYALSPYIYCRGRILGRLPSGAFVLAAAVRSLGTVDRLVVIAYRPDDNVGLNTNTQGEMAVARLYYYDLPNTGALRLHPQNMIDGTDWVTAGTVTVPGIMYASFWTFSTDGSKAVCLREGAAITDLEKSIHNPSPPPGAPDNTYNYLCTMGFATVYSGTITGIVCEWAIGNGTGLGVTSTALPANMAAGYTQDHSSLPQNPTWLQDAPPDTVLTNHYPLTPIAAGYVNNVIQVAYLGFDYCYLSGSQYTGTTIPNIGANNLYWLRFNYVGVGGLTEVYTKDLAVSTLVGSSAVVPETDAMIARTPLLIDLATAAFVCSSYSPRYVANITSTPAFNIDYTLNDANDNCQLNTNAAVHRVRVFRHNALVNDQAYPHPSPVLWNYYDTCEVLASITGEPTPTFYSTFTDYIPSLFVQPFIAARFGEEIIGYNVGINTSLLSYQNFGSICAPTTFDVANSAYPITNPPPYIAVGGWYTSTFALPYTGAVNWFRGMCVC